MRSVPVAACTHVFEAEIVRGRLADAEIAAHLRDHQIVTADWLVSVAVGGVKVCVAAANAGAARALLAEDAPEPEGYEPPTAAEVASWRALFGALIAGPAFLGTAFAVYHLGRVVATADGEDARTWRRAGWAALVITVMLLPFLLAPLFSLRY